MTWKVTRWQQNVLVLLVHILWAAHEENDKQLKTTEDKFPLHEFLVNVRRYHLETSN
jgi:hypothetical protein